MEIVIDGVRYIPESDACACEDENNHKDADGREIDEGDFVKVRLSVLENFPFTLSEDTRYGKVVDLTGSMVGVEFPTANASRHDCDGNTAPGHGYYFYGNQLRIVE